MLFRSLVPAPFASLDFALDFPNPAIGKQERSVRLAEDAFKRDLSRARTFGFAEEVELLRKAGLARGGSLDNAVVIGADRVLNREGLRYDDEFVRHKILDAIGDLYLVGHPLLASYEAHKSGHALNNQLLRALFDDADAWVLVDDVTAPLEWSEAGILQATA